MKKSKGFILLEYNEIKDHLMAETVDRRISEIQNHHTYLPDYASFKRRPDPFLWLENMKNYHVGQNGWSDIAQNITTFPDGTLAICRPLSTVPAGISGHNAQGVCIEHLGNFDDGQDQMTDAHRKTIIHVNAVLLNRFNLEISTKHVIYHHWYHTKTCPGTAFFGGNTEADANKGFIPLVKAELDRIRGVNPPEPKPDQAPIGYRMVTASQLNIRSAPDAKSSKEGMVSGGNILPVYEESGGWARISLAHPRWVSAKYLQVVEKGTVSADVLNVRSGPGASYRVLDTLKKGVPVIVYERNAGWCRIDLNEKWVSATYIQ